MPRSPNPLKVDPQRLGMLRRVFLGAVRGEFKTLQSQLWEHVVTRDVFGLRDIKPLSFNTQWKYLSLDQQQTNFQQWLKQGFRQTLLRRDPNTNAPWISPYVQQAYHRGVVRSFGDTHRLRRTMRPEWYQAQEQQFLRMTLGTPQGHTKEKVVVNRAFDQLKGVTDDIMKNTSRIVTVGLTARVQPQVLALRLISEIKGIKTPVSKRKSIVLNARKRRGTDARAAAIVSTESSYAHAEGQLDALDALGLEDVDVLAEWINGLNPCPDCEELEGTRWKLEDAYGLIPLHPHCQCAFAAVDREGDWITSDWFV